MFTNKYLKNWPITQKNWPVITSHWPLFTELSKMAEKISHIVCYLTNFNKGLTIIFNIKPANNKKVGRIYIGTNRKNPM